MHFRWPDREPRRGMASLSNPNLLPPESWTLHIVGSASIVPRTLAVFAGRLYTGTSSGLFFYANNSWTEVPGLIGKERHRTGVICIRSAGRGLRPYGLLDLHRQCRNTDRDHACRRPVVDHRRTADGKPVVATTTLGLLTSTRHGPRTCRTVRTANQFLNVAVDPDGIVWCGSGDVSGSGLFRFDGTTGRAFTMANSKIPSNDIYRMSVGCDGTVYASSYGRGLIAMPSGERPRSTARSSIGRECRDAGPCRRSQLYRGQQRGLRQPGQRVDEHRAGRRQEPACRPLIRRQMVLLPRHDRRHQDVHPDGPSGGPLSWCGCVRQRLGDRARCGVPRRHLAGQSGAIDSTAAFHLTASNGLPSSEVKTLLVDKDNDIWIGTDRGIAIILEPSNPLRSGAIAAYKPLNGLVINTITIDPLNQKWVGTTEGVFLLSPDGTQTLASYTVENTAGKLMDNDVKSIACRYADGDRLFRDDVRTGKPDDPCCGAAGVVRRPDGLSEPLHRSGNSAPDRERTGGNSELKIVAIDGTVIGR